MQFSIHVSVSAKTSSFCLPTYRKDSEVTIYDATRVLDVVQSTSKHNSSLMLPTYNTPSVAGQICSQYAYVTW